ncbi:peptidyl-tRNA hydrolase [Striga asiatica]|uniref:Peptidyl-tRNA hydrolase n=1 Tax=Striga asiatica TaxID=4170 RepID=A0A5A7P2J7_STRAF|nr:peptidyl-tRNA hydrolase [Striga asiatica]
MYFSIDRESGCYSCAKRSLQSAGCCSHHNQPLTLTLVLVMGNNGGLQLRTAAANWWTLSLWIPVQQTILFLKQKTRTAGGTANWTSWLYPSFKNKRRPSDSALALKPTPTILRNLKNLASMSARKLFD